MTVNPNFATVITEVAFVPNSTASLILDDVVNGLLNTGTLDAGSGLVPSWTAVSSYTLGFNCSRGRRRQIDQFSAGNLSAQFDNTDGRFSPTNLSGPYVSGGATEVKPGIPIRVRATWNGTTYNVWYGYITSWSHDVNASAPAAMFASVNAIDAFQRLSRVELLAQTPAGAGELSGARVSRLLDLANWDTGLRDIDTGLTTLQSSDMSGVVLQSLQTVTDSENGAFYVSESGNVTFRDRDARATNTRSTTSQATFTDSAGSHNYGVIAPLYDDDLVINRAQYTRVGGSTQTYNDISSQAQYGVITDTKDNLLNQSDSEVLAAAGWVVARFRNAEQRIDSITINPMSNPTVLWPLVLGLKIDDLITVTHHPAAGDAFTQDVFIEAISHKSTPETWTTTFQLSSAAAWLPFLHLDSSTRGVLNQNALAY